ncbi:MAG: hypothetical protein DHS80DRAFT_26038 [Piptocephalis tieghemiana]|nr:MAG: hypothetical protein DHS80DRAFT_26038 [Piptocephalis tieghemiana]
MPSPTSLSPLLPLLLLLLCPHSVVLGEGIQANDTVLLLDRYATLTNHSMGNGKPVWNARLDGYAIQIADPISSHRHLTRWSERYLSLDRSGNTVRRQQYRDKLGHIFGSPSPDREIIGINARLPSANWSIDFDHVTSDSDGLFSAENILLPHTLPPGSSIPFSLRLPQNDTRSFSASIHLFAPTGWMVISDIDDTIKWTGAINGTMAFRNMLVNDDSPIPGMPHLYQHLLSSLSIPSSSPDYLHLLSPSTPPAPLLISPGTSPFVSFFYLSGSPWRMGGPIQSFLSSSSYPPGVLELSGLRVNKPYSIYVNADIGRYKVDKITNLLAQFPHRNWIWIGDSGQADPRVYGDKYRDLMREQPDRPIPPCIFIRRVRGVSYEKESLLNTAERFRWDFRGIPADRWMVFDDPSVIERVNLRDGLCYPQGEINPWVDPWEAHNVTTALGIDIPEGSKEAERDPESSQSLFEDGVVDKLPTSEKFWLRKHRFRSMRKGWKHILGLE